MGISRILFYKNIINCLKLNKKCKALFFHGTEGTLYVCKHTYEYYMYTIQYYKIWYKI